MIALEAIHQLPLRDKLLMLEVIWDDISRQEQDLEVPQWHKELLDERERLLADGKAKFVDWEQAKRQINEAILDSAPSQRGITSASSKDGITLLSLLELETKECTAFHRRWKPSLGR